MSSPRLSAAAPYRAAYEAVWDQVSEIRVAQWHLAAAVLGEVVHTCATRSDVLAPGASAPTQGLLVALQVATARRQASHPGDPLPRMLHEAVVATERGWRGWIWGAPTPRAPRMFGVELASQLYVAERDVGLDADAQRDFASVLERLCRLGGQADWLEEVDPEHVVSLWPLMVSACAPERQFTEDEAGWRTLVHLAAVVWGYAQRLEGETWRTRRAPRFMSPRTGPSAEWVGNVAATVAAAIVSRADEEGGALTSDDGKALVVVLAGIACCSGCEDWVARLDAALERVEVPASPGVGVASVPQPLAARLIFPPALQREQEPQRRAVQPQARVRPAPRVRGEAVAEAVSVIDPQSPVSVSLLDWLSLADPQDADREAMREVLNGAAKRLSRDARHTIAALVPITVVQVRVLAALVDVRLHPALFGRRGDRDAGAWGLHMFLAQRAYGDRQAGSLGKLGHAADLDGWLPQDTTVIELHTTAAERLFVARRDERTTVLWGADTDLAHQGRLYLEQVREAVRRFPAPQEGRHHD